MPPISKPPQKGGLRKLIIPLLLIAAIFFFLKSGDETPTEEKTETEKTEKQKVAKKGSETLTSEKLGITFSHPAAWGKADAESETSLAIVFSDTCAGTDCDSLFIQKITSSDPNFTQIFELIKTLEKVETRPGFSFYQDTEKKVVTANKLFVDNEKGTIYTFELTGKTVESEKFDSIIASLKEIPVTTSVTIPPSTTGAITPQTTADTGTTPAPGEAQPVATQTYKFQCNDLANYAREGFYSEFVTTLTKVGAFSDPASVKTYGKIMLGVNDVKQACYSAEGKIFLALIPKGHSPGTTEFHLMKYNLNGKTLVDASRRGNWSSVTGPAEFAKRDGQIIHMNSSIKEGACIKTATYDYNYIENSLTAKELCTSCEGQAEKKCEQLEKP